MPGTLPTDKVSKKTLLRKDTLSTKRLHPYLLPQKGWKIPQHLLVYCKKGPGLLQGDPKLPTLPVRKKTFILLTDEKTSLNKRKEILSKFRHRDKWLLKH